MARRAEHPAALEERLGYRFTDPQLLEQALTHVSRQGEGSYQRLEFLGDRVLGLAVADMLMAEFPGAGEGDLSRRFAELVRRETCAEVADAWQLGPHIKVGGKAGGVRRNLSILSDVCEAVIAAVYLDGGLEAARELVRRGFGPRLASVASLPPNPKTQLQEWAASLGRPPPSYVIVERSGPDHRPRFQIAVRVDGIAEAVGSGPSRRAAEQEAARAALVREGLAGSASAAPATSSESRHA